MTYKLYKITPQWFYFESEYEPGTEEFRQDMMQFWMWKTAWTTNGK